MSKKQPHSESGRHRGERREHDAAARRYEENVYSEQQPKAVRWVLYLLVAVVVITLTVMFIGGFIRW